MAIHSVEVGGTFYNVAEASAVNQKKLIATIGSRLAYNLGTDPDVQLDNNFLMGALLGSSEADFDKIASIVLYKTVKNGGDELVTIADFQGRITDYYMLVAEAVSCNLLDFLNWLSAARRPAQSGKTETATKAT